MKRGTTPSLPVRIDLDLSTVAHIAFVFKQNDSEAAPAILTKTYPDDVSVSDGVLYIPFSDSETRLFSSERPFFMDTRIVLQSGKIPQTNISKLYMKGTLFSEVYDSG